MESDIHITNEVELFSVHANSKLVKYILDSYMLNGFPHDKNENRRVCLEFYAWSLHMALDWLKFYNV